MSIILAILSFIGTIIIGVSLLPTVISVIKSKKTDGISLSVNLLTGISTLLFTLYGIGLVVIPDPRTNSEIANMIGNGSFSFSGVSDMTNNSWIDAVYKNYIFSFIIPGIGLILGEAFLCVSSFIVVYIILVNMVKNKKVSQNNANSLKNKE